jgi:phosphomannomutase
MVSSKPKHEFDPTILREYDIRGVVGATLHPTDAWAIGRSFGTLMEEGGTVAVGYDGRISSPELEAALVEGLTASGVDVLRIGRGPTPMLYYAVMTQDVVGGIQVTGSHNPPTHNGFKMMRGRASFFGDDIRRLGEVAAAGAWRQGAGQVRELAIFDEYVARLARDFRGGKKLTVVWDAGNGAAGEAMAALTSLLPGTHVLLNEVIDGNFPAHHPDPTEPHNLIQLQDKVSEVGADLGIAFDGDGDRIGVVDRLGRILWGDQLLAILARGVLAERPGATIIADVKASQVLFDQIAAMGGKPLMWRTGHSLIKAKMAETGAPLAGEMSGHIFFADHWYGFDDALYAAVRLLSILAESGEDLAGIRDRLPAVVNTPELRFPCAENRKFRVVTEVRDRLRAAGARVSEVDGVRVATPEGWWLLRASNTQDVLVARAEATDEEGLARLEAALADQLAQSGIRMQAG